MYAANLKTNKIVYDKNEALQCRKSPKFNIHTTQSQHKIFNLLMIGHMYRAYNTDNQHSHKMLIIITKSTYGQPQKSGTLSFSFIIKCLQSSANAVRNPLYTITNVYRTTLKSLRLAVKTSSCGFRSTLVSISCLQSYFCNLTQSE